MDRHIVALTGVGLVVAAAPAWALPTALESERPLVFGHRGAPGYLPENTIEGFDLAMDMGADGFELDIVLSKDNQLVVLHDPYLSRLTNVESRPEFADRQREVGGRTDWWAADFTLAELKTLEIDTEPGRAASPYYDPAQTYRMPTYQEALDWVEAKERETGREILNYTEVKTHETYSADTQLDLLVSALEANGLTEDSAPVIVQSFDYDFMRAFEARPETDVATAQLLGGTWEDLGVTDQETLARFLDEMIAPHFDIVHASRTLWDTAFAAGWDPIALAHEAGLLTHAYTFRTVGDPVADEEAYLTFYRRGIDGVLSDYPIEAVAARDAFEAPEPGTLTLLGVGLAGLAASTRAKRRRL
jgi:glycerophosphoryl diester phosphodiesterase